LLQLRHEIQRNRILPVFVDIRGGEAGAESGIPDPVARRLLHPCDQPLPLARFLQLLIEREQTTGIRPRSTSSLKRRPSARIRSATTSISSSR